MKQDTSPLPLKPGVYFFKDKDKKILYIGKAKLLKNRVASYFVKSKGHSAKIKKMIAQIDCIECIETQSETEAFLLEAKMIQEFQPKYNSRQKDDKSYPYIFISKEDFPKVSIGRKYPLPKNDADCYGPYVEGMQLKKIFKILQKIFKFRTCGLQLSSKKIFQPCLLASIQYCCAPCAGKISQENYGKEILALKKFLQGNHKSFLVSLYEQMEEESKNLQFEVAAKIRDQILIVENLSKYYKKTHKTITANSPIPNLLAIKEALNLNFIPKIIEGIDISHHAGKEAVGSLVVFINGVPHTPGYRRYKIQNANTKDDYSMLVEVIQRRFCGQDKKRKLPDILLVDGGKGQLHSIVKALEEMKICIPAVIGLAKKKEEIFVPNQEEPIDQNDLAKQLFCRVRDEAHRFAQKYHHWLQKKSLFPDC